MQHFDWPLPLHGGGPITAIDEWLAELLTALCHAHATQSKLAAAIKRKGMHMTSVRQDANIECA